MSSLGKQMQKGVGQLGKSVGGDVVKGVGEVGKGIVEEAGKKGIEQITGGVVKPDDDNKDRMKTGLSDEEVVWQRQQQEKRARVRKRIKELQEEFKRMSRGEEILEEREERQEEEFVERRKEQQEEVKKQQRRKLINQKQSRARGEFLGKH